MYNCIEQEKLYGFWLWLNVDVDCERRGWSCVFI